jgi:hypothetical protein
VIPARLPKPISVQIIERIDSGLQMRRSDRAGKG